jgi:Lrp/AsnC family transcriptional regulator for asnA, asnC and gidA
MVQRSDVDLDDLDLKILREMEADGRQSISALAKTLGISRAYAGKRLQSLLDRKVTRIVTFTDPRVLGFRTMAIVGIQCLAWPISMRRPTSSVPCRACTW